MWRSLLIAGRFLTRLPFPDPGQIGADDLGRAVPAYPLVGLIIGLLLWGTAVLLEGAGQPDLAAALLVAVWVQLTGALHLDGLADTADAWVGGMGDRARTLDIMKDPTSGPMGVVAVVLVLLCKWTALAVLLGEGVLAMLIWAPTLARAQLLLSFLTTSYVRPQGMGAEAAARLPRRVAWVAVGAAALGCNLHLGTVAVILLALATVLFWLWRRAVVARLGGFSGDTAGALVELTETALLVAAAFWY